MVNAPSITSTSSEQSAVPSRLDLPAAIKDSLKAAAIALGLSIPILSYRTDQSGADLFLTPRWGLVAVFVAIIFGLRLFQHVFMATRAARYAVPDPHQATEWRCNR